MLISAKKDSVPTTQKSCVVYEFLCQCEARYAGRTTQRLADRIIHVPSSIINSGEAGHNKVVMLFKYMEKNGAVPI